ncbi:MAG: glycosyltransferase family 2 protein [Thermoplasmatales archaeon]
MPFFSIELITRGEKTTEKTIESVLNQTERSFEIVVCNSSEDPATAKMLKGYGIEFIQEKPATKHLKARFTANTLSKGDFSLLLDSTRILDREALSVIRERVRSLDMLAVKEGTIGDGFWVRQAARYKKISESARNVESFVDRKSSFILPRVYRGSILKNAFKSIKNNTTDDIFERISYGEHHIIFEEALKFSSNVGYYGDRELIFHFEDTKFKTIWKKYYYYGTTQIELNNLAGYSASRLSSHVRLISAGQILNEIECFPYITARIIPFALGLIVTKLRNRFS